MDPTRKALPCKSRILRFIVELFGVAALAYAGFQTSDNVLIRALTTIGAPVVLIVAWAALVVPDTANGLSQPQKDIIGTVLLLLAAVPLGFAGRFRLSVIFGTVVLANAALLFVFGQDAMHTSEGLAR